MNLLSTPNQQPPLKEVVCKPLPTEAYGAAKAAKKRNIHKAKPYSITAARGGGFSSSKKILFLCTLYLLHLSIPLLAQNDKPFLRINTQMHSTRISRIDSDSRGKYILTCSNDKTGRLWESGTGKLLRVLRPPIADGNEGLLYACALSPDGKHAALAGLTGRSWESKYCIYIFRTETGELTGRVRNLDNAITDLEYSPDGQFLAACLSRNGGVRIIETTDYTIAKVLTGYDDVSYNAAFSFDGRLATVSYDGYIRLYDKMFSLIKKIKPSGGSKPFNLAFSPDGLLIAAGFKDSNRVQILDGRNLFFKYEADNKGIPKNKVIDIPAWSSDGRYLYAAGTYKRLVNNKEHKIIRRWDIGGKGAFIDYPCGESIFMDLKTLQNGDIIFAGTLPDWGRINFSNNNMGYKHSTILDFRTKDTAHLKVSKNGSEIGLTPLSGEPLSFSLTDFSLKAEKSTGSSFLDKRQGINVTNWKNSYNPKLNGNSIFFLGKYEICRSVSVAPSGKHIIFGTEWNLYNLSPSGTVQWRVSVPGAARAVNCSADERLIITALSDGTVRWYRLSDGKMLLSLFIDSDRKHWVVWSSSGYYACSPGGQELIGWHVNRGIDQAADYFSVSRFQKRFYRPDVISLILSTLDEKRALTAADNKRNIRQMNHDLMDILPPVITILSPSEGYISFSERLEVKFFIRTSNNDPVQELRVMINGRPVETSRGLNIIPADRENKTVSIHLKPGENYISLMGKNSVSWSDPTGVTVIYNKKDIQYTIKPKLYVLAIGISKYKNPEFTLQYASKDAEDFIRAVTAQKGKLYRDVVVRLLTDDKATQDTVFDGLDWIKRETTGKDVAMIFIAGHGINDNSGRFYFLTHEADLNKLRRTTVDFDEIAYTIQTIPGKVLYFMDTCHSGRIKVSSRRGAGDLDLAGLINELASAENGAVVFSSSSGKQFSLEDSNWKNGAFTKALVEGLSGKADLLGKGKITVNMLDLYISERVKELTDGQQTPTTAKPDTIPDFPIAVEYR